MLIFNDGMERMVDQVKCFYFLRIRRKKIRGWR